jgi:hypothetical protein
LWVDDVRLVAWDVPAGQPVLADVADLGKVSAPLTLAGSRVR